MSCTTPKDGILLLLQAAKTLHEEELFCKNPSVPEKIEHRGPNRTLYEEKYSNSSQHYLVNHRRGVTSTRCTHNELEKSRRAHLRTCMENLKEHLNFDSDVPRITMLTVLKKAKATIQFLTQENQCLETCEDNEKQRFAQLMKRRLALRKFLEQKRTRSIKLQCWRERNRNYSECSVATTSSEDSEGDFQIHPFFRSGLAHSGAARPSISTVANGPSYAINSHKPVRIPTSPTAISAVTNMGLDAFDASSSDSGYEEVTIASSGSMSPDVTNMVLCSPSVSHTESLYGSRVCKAL